MGTKKLEIGQILLAFAGAKEYILQMQLYVVTDQAMRSLFYSQEPTDFWVQNASQFLAPQQFQLPRVAVCYVSWFLSFPMAFLPSVLPQSKGLACQFTSYWGPDNAATVCFRVRREEYYLLLWARGERGKQ